ncbi:hypothetical protein IWQ57_001305 [Coemansia nantahalensis]|uniref:Uncharacterized protein n=1 Tax=Coemansia nantahalensis TaxID=2789366 RepID=A0ACC1K5H2_9FUNG|nr:hypothetical protein IWQ57_001305 [Coemansia nantahalensis]
MAEAPEEKRVYIGGFAQMVTVDDVRGRFAPFGQVRDVDLPAAHNGGATRGFGYVTISITPSQWQRCTRVYSGAAWKGGKMRIEEAREDYTARLRREMAESADPAARPPGVKGGRRARSDGKHADDMALVTAKNIGRYAGWTKNRYGRPVLKYSIIRPDGRRFTYDPIRCAKSYERLAGAVSGKRLSDLEWEYSAERAQEDFAQARRSKGDRSKGDGGFESDADSDIPDLESLERSAGAGAVYAAFDDAEEVAALMTTAPAELSRELREKLASGAFDSSSDDDSDSDQMPAAPAGRIRPGDAVADSGAAMSAEDIALDEERKRTAAILARLVGSTVDTVDSPAGVLELGEMDAEPHDGASGKASKSASSTPDSSSSSSSSSASSDDSSSDSSSGGSPTGSPSNNGSSGADDSDSDDDSNPTSSGSSSSDADSDSDSEDEEDKADAMDVDESDKPAGALKSLFGKTDGEAAAGGQFLFTEMLGLEADQRAAALEAEAAGDYAGPVTGGSRVAGPAERNLNANRLPMFFPDVDAPTFRRPEAAFQRQKTEEELEADLANARHELADEYKALQRASVRRARKLRQPAP